MNTTQITENSTEDQCAYLQQWSFYFRLYFLYFFVAPVGIIGNGIALVVLLKKVKDSICLYLTILAFSDTFAIILEILGRSSVGDLSDASCAGVHYARHALKCFSHFLILLGTIEACYKLYKHSTPTNLKRVILPVTLALVYSLAANGYMIVTNGLNNCHQCNPRVEWATINLYCYLFLNFVPLELLAAVILAICGVVSMVGLSKIRKAYPAILQISKKKDEEEAKDATKTLKVSTGLVPASDWARMMMGVTIAFVILRLPYACAWLYDYLHYQVYLHPNDLARFYLMQAINILSGISAFNFGVKFYIYIFFRGFRS